MIITLLTDATVSDMRTIMGVYGASWDRVRSVQSAMLERHHHRTPVWQAMLEMVVDLDEDQAAEIEHRLSAEGFMFVATTNVVLQQIVATFAIIADQIRGGELRSREDIVNRIENALLEPVAVKPEVIVPF